MSPTLVTVTPDWTKLAPVAETHRYEGAPATGAISSRSKEDAGGWSRDVCQMQWAPPQRRAGVAWPRARGVSVARRSRLVRGRRLWPLGHRASGDQIERRFTAS